MYVLQPYYIFTGYLMAGAIELNSDRNSYSQLNSLLQNDYSAENSTSIDKDKTPMCLVNELARFNKVSIIYFKSIYTF